MDRKLKIKELKLNEEDTIFVSFQTMNNEIKNLQHFSNLSSANLNEDTNSDKNFNTPLKIKKKYIVIFISIALIFIGLTFFFIYYFLFRSKQEKKNNKEIIETQVNEEEKTEEISHKKEYNMEELITKKRPYYPINHLFIYNSDKVMQIELESEMNKTNDAQKKSTIKEYMDFSLIIKEENEEIIEEQNLIKKWYTGYISLLNLTINNGTHDIGLNYNNNLQKYISEFDKNRRKNLRALNEATNSTLLINENELCFVKINFYENGEIRDIFIPEGLNEDNMVYINKIINLIIPKLSKNLYSENINEKIEEIDNLIEENNDEEEEILEEYSTDETYEQEYFEEKDEIYVDFNNDDDNNINYNNYDNSLRKISEINDTIENIDLIYDDYGEELEIENINSTSEDDTFKYNLKGIEENETFSKIIDFNLENIEGAHAKLEGSNLRRIRNSFIDEKGMLVFIVEKENITIIQPDKESLSDLTEEEYKLKSEIYNENNEIKKEDEEEFIGQNISFGISNIKSDSYNNISLYNNLDDEQLIKNIFDFFDNFSYYKYQQINEDELKFRVLKDFKDDLVKQNGNLNPSEIEMEHTLLSKRKKDKRNLETSNSYYGMKNFEKEKVLFKYNLIGLILEGIIVTKIYVSSGVSDSYIKFTIGFINLKIKFNTMKTNLHIIIKNTNQMTYNFMSLLYFSNEDLIQRNKIYSDIFLDMEKNVSKLFEEYYDYSGLFRDSMEYLYSQVKNFSGEFFNELIDLIENVYDDYIAILNKSDNNYYENLNEIRNVIKNEYLNYIDDMFNIIISFKNDTSIFLYNIKQEVEAVNSFQLDILYDIIDIIDDGKLVFKEFIKKLFKAVEKGVNIFKYDLRDYMEEIIGDLLYLTDFLSVNINKNEILKNAIALEKRQNITVKLKNFRNIIFRIEEILNNNIINDYEEEMSNENENSIRYTKNYLIQNAIEEIDNKSCQIIEEIKTKILYMNYYEAYANEIQIINDITNKSFIELKDDLYNFAINDIRNISPEYLDYNSDLILNKNNLFSLSVNVINQINQQINEINNYIEIYSRDYINKNKYNLDFNLYNFRTCFSKIALSSLIDKFLSIIKEELQVHFIKMIDENYALANQYMEEVLKYFKTASSYKLLGTYFINTYTKYKTTFTEISYLTSSDEFLDFIQDNFYNVSKYIINYVEEKINSINKYYFHENNGENFKKLELIQDEILSISKNIENYFNEMTLESGIKMTILNISLNEIQVFNKEKEKIFDELYNSIYGQAQQEKINNMDCDIIQLIITKKKKWYRRKKKISYDYYCRVKVQSRNNYNKIKKDLSETKKHLSDKFNNLIMAFINKFNIYLNNYISLEEFLYNDLYKYTEEKLINNKNIELIFNDYQAIYNNILINNKTFEKMNINDKDSNIINILDKFEKNLFDMNNNFIKIII